MSKVWYPVINYEVCSECGACSNKCTNDVFALKNIRPVVVKPENCIEGCKGCSTLCPLGAIEYIGDASEGCCSDSGCCNC
ncbi:MAG TPA: 4Fe-4S dicluster domain-containing protein [Clostridia bacterium]|nr:4Fe-4S dicluster domain-containing protein [Clostridia bacterium]